MFCEYMFSARALRTPCAHARSGGPAGENGASQSESWTEQVSLGTARDCARIGWPPARKARILNSSAARSKASGHWNSCVAAAARKITKPARGTSTLGHYLRIGAAKASRSPAGEHSPQSRLIIGSGSAAENGTLRVIFGVGFCPLGLRARVPWELLWAAALGTHPRKCRGRIRPRR